MNKLKIKICGQQNIVSPKLSVTLMIDNTQFVIDPCVYKHELEFEYDSSQITKHSIELKVDRKKEYLNKFYKQEILDDVPSLMYIIDSIESDGHSIFPIIEKTARYHHNTNGDSLDMVEDFTNVMGFDGTIKFTILTPMFTWFLTDFEF
jgi:hypothetical protein